MPTTTVTSTSARSHVSPVPGSTTRVGCASISAREVFIDGRPSVPFDVTDQHRPCPAVIGVPGRKIRIRRETGRYLAVPWDAL